ncbi:Spc24 subunit of Ndc80-domain-containing protein [Biscogniauxia mediterranea]|nr:Spc24 subunit of Ndc80-domain-containing protein [Biscogniauxia mediterranea]
MLLDEDPAALISHTVNNFNIAPDKNAISRINDSILDLQEKRKSRVRAAEADLKKLARALNTQQTQYEELTAAHSSSAHASEISRLDTQKFRIAKAASDLEMEAERLSSQQADLAARLQELELQGLEGAAAGQPHDPVDDEVLLRLRVYRSLGIDLERDERDGEFAKAIVRNDRKGDVHVVNLDKKFSRFFYANYFWQTL